MRKLWLLAVCLLCGFIRTLQVGAIDFAQKIKYSFSYTWNTETEIFTAWIISIPDPNDSTKWFTIMDRNLWATTTWAWFNAEESSYGYFYQRGNNNWNYSGSTTTTELLEWNDSYLHHWYDWENKWIIISPTYYRTIRSGNMFYNTLWWWENDNYSNNFWYPMINPEDRQWPCPSGYHVPSVWEWNELFIYRCKQNSDKCIWDDLFDDSWIYNYRSIGNLTDLPQDFLLPYFNYHGTVSAFMWTSSAFWDPRGVQFDDDQAYLSDFYADNNPRAIRCFSNEYMQAVQLTFKNGDDELDSWYTIKWHTWDKLDDEPTKEWYKLERYLSWFENDVFDFENTPINDDTTLYAKWTPIEYTITFDTDWWSTIAPITWNYWTAITKPADPTKNGYTFDWREPAIPDTMPAKNLTIKAKRTKQSSWRSGGGWSMKKDNCPNGDLSPSYYDGECWSDNNTWNVIQSETQWSEESSNDSDTTVDYSDKSEEWQTWNQDEFLDAYNFAFKHGITTMDTIEKANLDWYIKRWHLAKMITNYVVNVLWKEIPSDIPASCLSFNDEATVRESEEIKDYAIKSCTLWLMWINMKNNEFLPNDYVPRSQFGAVLSRILRWDKYNKTHTQDSPWYSAHLNALKNDWIMKMIDNPKMLEKRWYVMLMLMRSAK